MNSIKTFICILILSPTLIYAQWEKVNVSGIPWEFTGWAIDACDTTTAIMSVNIGYPDFSHVFFTDDKGDSWSDITPIEFLGSSIIDVSMISPSKIWIVSESIDSSHILFSDNLGETWTVQYSDSFKTQFFNYIEMFDESNGIAMGDRSSTSDKALFLRTTDGGINWQEMENNISNYGSGDTWRRLDFVSIDIGYHAENYYGRENQGIKKTIDGGNTWEVIYPNIGIDLIKFYDENIGLARNIDYGEGGIIKAFHVLRTLDGGVTWQTFETDSSGWANDFEFIPGDPSQVWFVDGWGNSLFFSSDTGRTWSKQSLNGQDIYGRDIVFVDESHGWILGDDSNLLYTTNNGGIITDVEKIVNEEIPNEIVLYQNYPNPFNPVTTIKYQLPSNVKSETMPTGRQEANGSKLNVQTGYIPSVRLVIYDILGKEVTTLVNQKQKPGKYEVTFDATNLSSGIYYYQLTAGNFIKTNKMILLK